MSLWSRIAAALAGIVRRRPAVTEALGPKPEAVPIAETGGPPWEDFDGGLGRIPIGRSELVSLYGDIKATTSAKGEILVSRDWEGANMMLARNLPGYGKPLYVHRRIEPYLREAMRRSLIACPNYVFHRVGCFSPRHERHNAAMPLSLHSWGVAVDIDAVHNGPKSLKTRLEPWSPPWLALWPHGIPRGVVESFESVGWEWGGRWFPYTDPMHMQLAWTRAKDPPATMLAGQPGPASGG